MLNFDQGPSMQVGATGQCEFHMASDGEGGKACLILPIFQSRGAKFNRTVNEARALSMFARRVRKHPGPALHGGIR